MYGEGVEDIIDAKSERYVSRQLGNRGLGPKIYSEFMSGKGRIEEFLPGLTLKYEEMMQKKYFHLIADFVAGSHCVEMKELPKTPLCFPLLQKYYTGAKKVEKSRQIGLPKSADINSVLDILQLSSPQFASELEWLQRYCESFNSPVVFCHNDINEGNIIASSQDSTISLAVIDYEYAGYNYRGYDIANYFCECYVKNNDEASETGFSLNPDHFPRQHFRLEFLQRYLDTSASAGTVNSKTATELDAEILAFMLASHMTWLLWGVMQSDRSKINWGFIHYTRDRFIEYKRLKHLILNTSSSHEFVGSKRKSSKL